MRTTKFTSKFNRDYKREKSGRHRLYLDKILMEAVNMLEQDQPLPHRYFDHALRGNWVDHRDCHLKPDLVLIYRLPNSETLELVRLGSHSTLGI